jgi:nitroimidazol reductase NimA-like FMN-containing flavoprotein (pyridoxamine 5'-phosphate oxidase superfamily)
MEQGKPSTRSKIVRSPNRGHYDKESLYKVLDAGFLCHVSYLFEESPVIIPTAFVRIDDILYIHGAVKNRMMISILNQQQACVSVTHLDGMVLARSAFHHSFNYRSAVVFGVPEKVDDEVKKLEALRKITENILPGRWQEVREPSEKEMKGTLVIAIKIEEASVKIREGAPVDDKADYELPIWAGELPLVQSFIEPITDPLAYEGLEVPQSVLNILKSQT